VDFDATREHPPGTYGWLVDPSEEMIVYGVMCVDPDCPCDDIFLRVAEVDEEGTRGPHLAQLAVSANGFGVSSGRPDLVKALRVLPRGVVHAALRERDEHQMDRRHQEAYRVPKWLRRSGELLCWTDYYSAQGSIFSRGRGYIRVDVDHSAYAVDFAFCPNPKPQMHL